MLNQFPQKDFRQMKEVANTWFEGRKFLGALAVVLLAACATPDAKAACNAGTLQLPVITLGAVSVAANANSPGTVLTSAETPATTGIFASCSGTNTYSYAMSGTATGPITAGSKANVYPTNIPGIGMRFYFRNNAGIVYRWPASGSDSSLTWKWDSNGTPYWGAEVIVTDSTVGSGTYDGVLSANFSLGGRTYVNLKATGLSVVGRSCLQTTGSTVSLGMPTVMPESFGSAGTPTRAGYDKAFDIGLSCDYSLGVKLQIASNGSSTANVLANTTGTGMASGVGIQLFRGLASGDTSSTTVMPLDTKVLAASISSTGGGQLVSIPLIARYYKTGTLTAGKLSITTTYTLTYE